MTENPNRRFLRADKLPHFFCGGCGCGQVLNYFTQSLDRMNLDISEFVTIGGVGCTARIPVYLKSDTLHGVHGRTLAWATGIKMHRPELPIVIFAGDGDLASIGGNHFIHAARRNLDVTVIMVNNLNFAMTGGQVAPTTPEHARTMTTPYGSDEPRFDIARLALAAGAGHVERWTTAHHEQCVAAICRALSHKGFSLIEIISQCPTHFGRYALGTGDPVKLIQYIKDSTVIKREGMGEEELAGRLPLGCFAREEREVYSGTTNIDKGGEEA